MDTTQSSRAATRLRVARTLNSTFFGSVAVVAVGNLCRNDDSWPSTTLFAVVVGVGLATTLTHFFVGTHLRGTSTRALETNAEASMGAMGSVKALVSGMGLGLVVVMGLELREPPPSGTVLLAVIGGGVVLGLAMVVWLSSTVRRRS